MPLRAPFRLPSWVRDSAIVWEDPENELLQVLLTFASPHAEQEGTVADCFELRYNGHLYEQFDIYNEVDPYAISITFVRTGLAVGLNRLDYNGTDPMLCWRGPGGPFTLGDPIPAFTTAPVRWEVPP